MFVQPSCSRGMHACGSTTNSDIVYYSMILVVQTVTLIDKFDNMLFLSEWMYITAVIL